jgi:cation transport ATPase
MWKVSNLKKTISNTKIEKQLMIKEKLQQTQRQQQLEQHQHTYSQEDTTSSCLAFNGESVGAVSVSDQGRRWAA